MLPSLKKRKSTALIIDSNYSDCYLLKFKLSRCGFEGIVEFIHNKIQAIEYFIEISRGLKRKPKIIFIDLKMLDGFNILEMIAEKFSFMTNSKIILMSSSHWYSNTERIIKSNLPFDLTLRKPLEISEIKEILSEI